MSENPKYKVIRSTSKSPRTTATDPAWQATVTADIRKLTRAVNRHAKVIDKLNGGVDAIKTFKEIMPQLVTLAEHTERIVGLAEVKADDEIFWKGLRRRLNPFKPIGLGIWGLVVTTLSIIIVKIIFKI